MHEANDVDVVVVGAGPAGSTAALVLARAGRRVLLMERGPFPGSKNMYGGVVYGRILDGLVPGWYDEAPVQRYVTRRSTMILTDEQALTVDYRSARWGREPYNGVTTFRPDFDAWLAQQAVAAGAVLVCETTATGLLREGGRVVGVRTDRPDGDLRCDVVIACDGVNSFLGREAGLYPGFSAENMTLGAKETIGLPRSVIEERFGVRDREGVDIEILGGTCGIAGGGFVYTNLDSLSVGVVVSLDGLRRNQHRPEELIARLKAHPAIAPLVDGGTLLEYSAHLIPEGGYDAMPELAGPGILLAGDAAGLCLAAGIWLEGVNFAIGSGAVAGQVASDAIARGDTSMAALGSYRRKLEDGFVLSDHAKLRRAPHLVLSERVQQQYPGMICDLIESVFTVDNPRPKPGITRLLRRAAKANGVRLRDLARDALTAGRTYG